MTIAYKLRILQQGFHLGTFDKNLIKNLDEIHFTINMDNGCRLSFHGDISIKYVNVVVGGCHDYDYLHF